jgi:hypothetical protein|tara:strand:- start:1678 stop:1860 length:183 start_codon:yes stop_codon:yes gene_type:complete
MRSKRIEFIIGGLHIPGIGLTELNKIESVDSEIAKSLIEQGIAKLPENDKISKKTDKGDK